MKRLFIYKVNLAAIILNFDSESTIKIERKIITGPKTFSRVEQLCRPPESRWSLPPAETRYRIHRFVANVLGANSTSDVRGNGQVEGNRVMRGTCTDGSRSHSLDECNSRAAASHWYPRDGKRKRGKQHRRWKDELKLTAGPNWRRVTRDRKQRKILEEIFANRHTELRNQVSKRSDRARPRPAALHWAPTGDALDSSEKNYGTSVEVASFMIERCTAHVIPSSQHSSRAAPMSRCNCPPRHPSAV
ncbi:hypothetical protein EVAR_42372_1 [Eumeta japonica]|uniref:Uncharacterized protein n=1 Tax=Eumeta variegata TaxID=151549 RepID=A0A4C1YKG7_EUMVA|nr:hypothetical protein EVAR_42372_1 [Eumeta japonica]